MKDFERFVYCLTDWYYYTGRSLKAIFKNKFY